MGACLAAFACGPVTSGGPCTPLAQPVPLPAALSETSGAAVSRALEGTVWTHDDAGSTLFAVDESGRILGSYEVPVRFRDWEDLAVAACGSERWCLYAADVGDNYEERPSLRLIRLTEPPAPDGGAEAARARNTGPADVFPIRLPDGPRDIEALLVFPGESVFLVTKGRNHPVTVYAYPGALRPDTVTMTAVQELTDGPRILPRQITGGSVAPDGRTAALRSYQALQFYHLDGDTLAAVDGGRVNLASLGEPQGEGVALGDDGLVVLTSEGGPGGRAPSLAVLRCSVGGGR